MIQIPREVCRNVFESLTREWLVTNGRGSYASLTITGGRTRRYHGLLVAALDPPLGRTLLFAKLDEEVEVGGQTYRLGTDEFRDGVFQPEGFLYLQGATVEATVPTLTFGAGSFRLTKTIWMEPRKDTTIVRYRLDPASAAVRLTLLPFCTYRDFHSLTQGDPELKFRVDALAHGFEVTAFKGARPYRILGGPHASFTPLGLWYWRFRLRAEEERGLDAYEDLYLPGLFRAQVNPGETFSVIASTEPEAELDLDVESAWRRRRAFDQQSVSGARDEFEAQLFAAGEQFLVPRPGLTLPAAKGQPEREASTIIAGYHWFGDWGRDTMIALEGLTLTTGRFVQARDILLTYSRFVSEGMLPNRFPDSGQEPEYNTVDATLWFFHAIDRYLDLSGDRSLLPQLYPVLREIVDAHVKGTRYGIRMDPADGLLRGGEPGVQLTWMDVKIGDRTVTPRIGKPVEVNALWYNALCLMRDWSRELGRSASPYDALAEQANKSFEKFWHTGGGYFYDVIDGPAGNDASLRPNQLLALSLPHPAGAGRHARSVLEVVARELLTPFGLRTLNPGHPHYRGQFSRDRVAREEAYHNGTVWPWLIGPYIEAHRRAFPDAKGRLALFEPFKAHLAQAGLGTISECFEGDPPHWPVACIAQAWSVAEILRTYRLVSLEGAAARG